MTNTKRNNILKNVKRHTALALALTFVFGPCSYADRREAVFATLAPYSSLARGNQDGEFADEAIRHYATIAVGYVLENIGNARGAEGAGAADAEAALVRHIRVWAARKRGPEDREDALIRAVRTEIAKRFAGEENTRGQGTVPNAGYASSGFDQETREKTLILKAMKFVRRIIKDDEKGPSRRLFCQVHTLVLKEILDRMGIALRIAGVIAVRDRDGSYLVQHFCLKDSAGTYYDPYPEGGGVFKMKKRSSARIISPGEEGHARYRDSDYETLIGKRCDITISYFRDESDRILSSYSRAIDNFCGKNNTENRSASRVAPAAGSAIYRPVSRAEHGSRLNADILPDHIVTAEDNFGMGQTGGSVPDAVRHMIDEMIKICGDQKGNTEPLIDQGNEALMKQVKIWLEANGVPLDKWAAVINAVREGLVRQTMDLDGMYGSGYMYDRLAVIEREIIMSDPRLWDVEKEAVARLLREHFRGDDVKKAEALYGDILVRQPGKRVYFDRLLRLVEKEKKGKPFTEHDWRNVLGWISIGQVVNGYEVPFIWPGAEGFGELSQSLLKRIVKMKIEPRYFMSAYWADQQAEQADVNRRTRVFRHYFTQYSRNNRVESKVKHSPVLIGHTPVKHMITRLPHKKGEFFDVYFRKRPKGTGVGHELSFKCNDGYAMAVLEQSGMYRELTPYLFSAEVVIENGALLVTTLQRIVHPAIGLRKYSEEADDILRRVPEQALELILKRANEIAEALTGDTESDISAVRVATSGWQIFKWGSTMKAAQAITMYHDLPEKMGFGLIEYPYEGVVAARQENSVTDWPGAWCWTKHIDMPVKNDRGGEASDEAEKVLDGIKSGLRQKNLMIPRTTAEDNMKSNITVFINRSLFDDALRGKDAFTAQAMRMEFERMRIGLAKVFTGDIVLVDEQDDIALLIEKEAGDTESKRKVIVIDNGAFCEKLKDKNPGRMTAGEDYCVINADISASAPMSVPYLDLEMLAVLGAGVLDQDMDKVSFAYFILTGEEPDFIASLAHRSGPLWWVIRVMPRSLPLTEGLDSEKYVRRFFSVAA